jgi:hypothetical protein
MGSLHKKPSPKTAKNLKKTAGPGRPKGSGIDLWARKFDKQHFHTQLDKFLAMNDIEFTEACADANQFDSCIIALLIRIKRDQCIQAINTLWRVLGYIKPGTALENPNIEATTHVEQAAPPAAIGEADLYVVEMNEGGKFVRARPRLVQYGEQTTTIDVKAKSKEG